MKWISSLFSMLAVNSPLTIAARRVAFPSPCEDNAALAMVFIVLSTAFDKPLRIRFPLSMLMLNQRSMTQGSSPDTRKREA